MARKTKTMKNLFHRYILMTIAAAILAVISMPLFTILYFQTENIVFFILLLVTLGVLLAGYSLELIFYTLRLYKLFYSDIYQTTDRNLTKLKLHQKGLDLYQASEVGEVRKLNDNVLDLNYELEHMVQVALDKDYSKINLNYIDKKKRLVDHHTFHDHIAEIVFCSQSYRNVLIQAYYDFEGKGNLTPEEEEQLLDFINLVFSQVRVPHDFEALLPKVYAHPGFSRLHAVAAEEGRIRASYGCEGFLGPYEKKVRDYPFSCQAGLSIASVRIDGAISGCTSIRASYGQGNIYQDDFVDVWEHRFGIFRDHTPFKTGPCRDCRWWKKCKGNGMHLRGENGELLLCNLSRL